MRHLLLLLSGVFAQFAAAPQRPTRLPAPATRVQILGASGALFPAGAACHYVTQTTFTPTIPQAEEAERALQTTRLATIDPHAKNWVGKQPDPAYHSVSTHLRRYGQQFYGFYNARQQPCLFVNAFIPAPGVLSGPRWLRETVWGNDGGTYFWQAIYNVATHRLEYFSYNGMG